MYVVVGVRGTRDEAWFGDETVRFSEGWTSLPRRSPELLSWSGRACVGHRRGVGRCGGVCWVKLLTGALAGAGPCFVGD